MQKKSNKKIKKNTHQKKKDFLIIYLKIFNVEVINLLLLLFYNNNNNKIIIIIFMKKKYVYL